jgi:hypothetical protein
VLAAGIVCVLLGSNTANILQYNLITFFIDIALSEICGKVKPNPILVYTNWQTRPTESSVITFRLSFMRGYIIQL